MTDPPSPSSGIKQPRFRYDILIRTLTAVPVERPREEDAFVIIGPGEYQIQRLIIRGAALESESSNTFLKTIYLIDDGNLRLCLLGHISEKGLGPKLIEFLGEVDAIIVPGGGKPFINQEDAAELINQIEPSIVIPSCFKIPGLKRTSDDAKRFVKEFGSAAAPVEKITIKKKDLDPEETNVILLTPN
ncbi:MAG: hypothetical protein A3J67_02610 [Parcubacteria group bacterium RIFCSPHIGHO2_02_FULL_48_10b]|nr:MAG: hypothetical protein A3J67_02610 [Parcubacteria group bacterium RIFCSPHIGHO2_02_FULL_48_10b]